MSSEKKSWPAQISGVLERLRAGSRGSTGSRMLVRLVCFVLVLWLMVRQELDGHSFEMAMLLCRSLCILVTIGLAVEWLLGWLWRAPGHVDLRCAVALAAIGSLSVLDAMHYDLFREHFSVDGLTLGIQALLANEVPIDVAKVTAWVGGLAVWLVIAPVVMARVRMAWLDVLAGIADRSARGLAVTAIVLVVATGALADGDDALTAVRLALPWESAPSSPSAGLGVAFDGIELSERLEQDQLNALLRRRPAMLAAEVSATRTPDVLIVSIESLRADQLTAEQMPNLYKTSTRCLRLENHYSTSNNTGGGLFGLLTGMTGYYYQHARKRWMKPLPLELLNKTGYRIDTWYTRHLGQWDRLHELFFKDIVEQVHDIGGRDQSSKEAAMVSEYLAHRVAASQDRRPRLDLMVFYASHYPYYHPPQFAPHQPEAEQDASLQCGDAAEKRKKAVEVKNRFMNSIRYVDHLLGKLLDGLAAQGRLHDTVVLVTGDHGEEFWEHDRFGHTYGLVREQVQVAAVLCLPGHDGKSAYRYTSHADFMPTLFDHIGLQVEGPPLMTGKSLLRHQPGRDHALVAKGVVKNQRNYQYVIIGEGLKVAFNNFGKLRASAVTDLDDEPTSAAAADVRTLLSRALAEKSLGGLYGAGSTTRATLPVRELQQLVRSYAMPPAAIWPPNRSDAPIASERLVGGSWRRIRLDETGRPQGSGQVEFLDNGVIGVGSDSTWSRWRIQAGRLLVVDREGSAHMRFFHDAGESWLVTRAPGGQNYRLEPTLAVTRTDYLESLWPKGLASGAVAAGDLVEVDWDYRWYDASGREGGGRTVHFRQDGSFSRGETDNWHRWEIRRGHLYLFGVSGAFVTRFSYAAAQRMLVGHTADDDYFVLKAAR